MIRIKLNGSYNGSGAITVWWGVETRTYPSKPDLVRAIRGILNLNSIELDIPLEKILGVSQRSFEKDDPFELY